MKHINIVTVNSGWILQKIAERIVANAPEDVSMALSHTPTYRGNNFYIDVQNCYHGPTGGKDIGLFTHVHENNTKHLHDQWFNLDGVIHMSARNEAMWRSDRRFNPKQFCWAAMPGEMPAGFKFKKRTIGIMQRGKYEGKGFDFMKRLAENRIAGCFNWFIVGNDWEEVVKELMTYPEVQVTYIPDSSAKWPETYQHAFEKIDYLLIPSLWEGGPMSVIEAAAAGVPIIGARVGWIDKEVPVFRSFAPNDLEGCLKILSEIYEPQNKAWTIVEKLSYKEYARIVVQAFSIV